MSDTSTNLQLPFLAPAQAQKHVTVNEGLLRLDVLCQSGAVSRSVTAQPVSPGDGELYVIPSGKSGDDWSTAGDWDLAWYVDGAWRFASPREGWRVWVADEDVLAVWDGAAWASVTDGVVETEAVRSAGALMDDELTNAAAIKGVDQELAKISAPEFRRVKAYGDSPLPFAGENTSIGPGDHDCLIRLDAKDAGEAGFTFRVDGVQQAEFVTNTSLFSLRDNVGVRVGVETDAGMMLLPLLGAEPTGGAKGAGTLNAYGVYDDNTLLSCYPFDQALDGQIDAARWDALVPDQVKPARAARPVRKTEPRPVVREQIEMVGGEPVLSLVETWEDEPVVEMKTLRGQDGEPVIDPATGQARQVPVPVLVEREEEPAETLARIHEPLRKFASRIGTPHDPLTLDGYALHWKEKRHLTALPNEAKFDPHQGMPTGAWIQRLVETAEIQAILIEQLNERTKLLAARLDALEV